MVSEEEVNELYMEAQRTNQQEEFDNLQIKVIEYFIQELTKVKEKFGKEEFAKEAEKLRLFEFKFLDVDEEDDEESYLDQEIAEMFWMIGEGVSLERVNQSLTEAKALLEKYKDRPYKEFYKN